MASQDSASDPRPDSPETVNSATAPDSPALQARRLLRAARAGSLATSAHCQPFASLVTPACLPDGSLLLLLSSLSEHTRHLMADPRCAVMLTGAPHDANPQTMPRVTITGQAGIIEDAAAKARYLAIHPYAALYADFGDFATWRIVPQAALLVGGFARAHRLKQADLTPEPEAVAAILAAEAAILAHCNNDHADALAAIAGQAGGWRMVTADVDGFDLAQDETVRRFAWSAPVSNSGDVRRELVVMTKAARLPPPGA